MSDSKISFVIGAIYLTPHMSERVALVLSGCFIVAGIVMQWFEARGDK
jgi:hypothetical protein